MNISDCTDGQIRLVSYSTPSEGRLEYCQDGVWGTVCNQGWGAADSQVVCRELGYSSSGIGLGVHDIMLRQGVFFKSWVP